MIEDNADLIRAIYVLSTSPKTPAGVRGIVSGSLEDSAENRARTFSMAVRSLPARVLASYTELERAQLAAGLATAELLGY